jgi:hypothetical protein
MQAQIAAQNKANKQIMARTQEHFGKGHGEKARQSCGLDFLDIRKEISNELKQIDKKLIREKMEHRQQA